MGRGQYFLSFLAFWPVALDVGIRVLSPEMLGRGVVQGLAPSVVSGTGRLGTYKSNFYSEELNVQYLKRKSCGVSSLLFLPSCLHVCE